MNYAKVIGSALQLFPKKVKVTLIDATTGIILGKYKILAELLPTVFNRPIIIEINNIRWRVMRADPLNADDFLYSKKLSLHVQEATSINFNQLRFNQPSVCNELPSTGLDCFYDGFTLYLTDPDWRQIEFLPLSRSATIEDSMAAVEKILHSQPNPLLGYEQQFVRDAIATERLAIPMELFRTLLIKPVFGNFFFADKGFGNNGFSVKSESYTYYGIVEDQLITTLCLTQFDYADDELMRVLSTFQLLLVDWCNISRISAEICEESVSEFIKI